MEARRAPGVHATILLETRAMPIYEYDCARCRQHFELLVRTGAVPACPACDAPTLQKRLSAFSVGRPSPASGGQAPQACGSCGDPRGEGACSMN